MAHSVMRTRIEEDYGHPFNDAEWQAVDALDEIAEDLADLCCFFINKRASRIPREPFKYNEQRTLEQLINKLQARV